jgi:alpha-L-fucosidase
MNHLSRRTLLGASAAAAGSLALQRFAPGQAPSSLQPSVLIDDNAEPIQLGPFSPTWQSLRQYRVPDWFRDAKFGIWAHWGPQCQPEAGDWYARHMYVEGYGQYKSHRQRYGHPSKVGFKDVIHQWKAENWDPARLVALYKRVGARYFFAMGNHHDNLDMWDSKYQPWNSVAIGPKKDIIKGWADAARHEGLKFGVSLHAAHAWSWYEPSQLADREGPLKGVPYDGKLTKADGAGQWWEGLDPQDLYSQSHALSAGYDDPNRLHRQWHWGNGATPPDAAYCTKFYNRTIELLNRVEPELLYFDDTALPLWPVSDAGLRIAAHFYNMGVKRGGGQQDAVLFAKVLDEQQRQCMTWDIERGASNQLEPFPWQTDTCLGGWHYDRGVYDRRAYKSPATVIHMLADIVSKNGNLLLNVPVRGDGTIDELEEAILADVGAWIAINGEAIYATRPWKVFGEGPAIADSAPLSAQGFNEGKGKPFTAEDIRFTTTAGAIYAILLGKPTSAIRITSLGKRAGQIEGAMKNVELLGAGALKWTHEEDALTVTPPAQSPSDHAWALKITTA